MLGDWVAQTVLTLRSQVARLQWLREQELREKINHGEQSSTASCDMAFLLLSRYQASAQSALTLPDTQCTSCWTKDYRLADRRQQ